MATDFTLTVAQSNNDKTTKIQNKAVNGNNKQTHIQFSPTKTFLNSICRNNSTSQQEENYHSPTSTPDSQKKRSEGSGKFYLTKRIRKKKVFAFL